MIVGYDGCHIRGCESWRHVLAPGDRLASDRDRGECSFRRHDAFDVLQKREHRTRGAPVRGVAPRHRRAVRLESSERVVGRDDRSHVACQWEGSVVELRNDATAVVRVAPSHNAAAIEDRGEGVPVWVDVENANERLLYVDRRVAAAGGIAPGHDVSIAHERREGDAR